MPIEIKIADTDLEGFSLPARDQLREAAEEYIGDVIQEANRLEVGRNTSKGPPEVTQAMVHEAVGLKRFNSGSQRTPLKLKLFRVAAAALALIVGVLYDPASLQDSTYLLLFIIIMASAILAVMLSALWEW